MPFSWNHLYSFAVLPQNGKVIVVHKINTVLTLNTGWKVSQYGVFSGPYFPVFGLTMEIYSINLRARSEYRKIRTRKNSVFGHFSRSETKRLTLGNLIVMRKTCCNNNRISCNRTLKHIFIWNKTLSLRNIINKAELVTLRTRNA